MLPAGLPDEDADFNIAVPPEVEKGARRRAADVCALPARATTYNGDTDWSDDDPSLIDDNIGNSIHDPGTATARSRPKQTGRK
jgi:hypothetical protein